MPTESEKEIDTFFLEKSINTYCYRCGACDPLNVYGVCFICGKIPHIKTLKGFKEVIKGWFRWQIKKIK